MPETAEGLPRPALAGRSPFVGREREIATLFEQLEAVGRGEVEPRNQCPDIPVDLDVLDLAMDVYEAG